MFKEYFRFLKQIKEKEKELDFFENLYADKPEVQIFKKIIRPEKDYKNKIKTLHNKIFRLEDDAYSFKKEIFVLQNEINRLNLDLGKCLRQLENTDDGLFGTDYESDTSSENTKDDDDGLFRTGYEENENNKKRKRVKFRFYNTVHV